MDGEVIDKLAGESDSDSYLYTDFVSLLVGCAFERGVRSLFLA